MTPRSPIANRRAVIQWLAYGILQFAVTLAAMLLAPGEMSTTEANIPMTMAFVVLSLGSIFAGLAMRRDPESGLIPPVLGALKILAIPTVVTVFAVEAGVLQDLLMTTSLTGSQWLACLGWSLIIPIVVELDKAFRRRRLLQSHTIVSPTAAVAPQRAHAQ